MDGSEVLPQFSSVKMPLLLEALSTKLKIYVYILHTKKK